MKLFKVIFPLFLMLCFSNLFSQEANGPLLKFSKEKQDFGKIHIDNIPEGKVDIEFTNGGSTPLVLSNVRACCGTRVLDWPKEPILPGQSGMVKVHFQIQPRVHVINRTVTIMSNSINSPDVYKINGEVTDQIDNLIIDN